MSDPAARATLGDDDRWLAKVSAETRAFVRARALRRDCAAGEKVYGFGDPPDGLYQVVSGEVRLVSYASSGRRIVTLVARRGHWLGELSVLDGGPRPHDALATGATELLHLPMRDVVAFRRANPAFPGEVALIGCAHQRAALSFIGTILTKPGPARLAEMLLATASRRPGDEHPSVGISQEDLAGRIGVSRQHMARMIGELKRSGAIGASYGRIHLLDEASLAALAA